MSMEHHEPRPELDVKHFVLILPASGSAPPERWITCSSLLEADIHAQYVGGIAYEAHPVVDATGARVHRLQGLASRVSDLTEKLSKALRELEQARRDALVLAYTVALDDDPLELDPGARSALTANVLDKEGELDAAVERAAQQVGWKRQGESAP